VNPNQIVKHISDRPELIVPARPTVKKDERHAIALRRRSDACSFKVDVFLVDRNMFLVRFIEAQEFNRVQKSS
jgi:hypothetical protein